MEYTWGIIVAVGTDTSGWAVPATGIYKKETQGRPLESLPLIALGSVWRVLESTPFLYLVTPLGARRCVFELDQDGTAGSYQTEELLPSVDAATREYEGSGPGVRLVLVHLDTPDRFLHPGLLPWLSRFAPGFVPKKLGTLSITELLSACLDPHRKDPVFVAHLAPCRIQIDDWLQSPWENLMKRLTHKYSQSNKG